MLNVVIVIFLFLFFLHVSFRQVDHTRPDSCELAENLYIYQCIYIYMLSVIMTSNSQLFLWKGGDKRVSLGG